MAYERIVVPSKGKRIDIDQNGNLQVPDNPIVCFIEGDGTGPDIWAASQPVLDEAVARAYGGQKEIVWMEVYAGDKANDVYNEIVWLPQETLDAIDDYMVALKGPLTTPVGGGIRSINVALRQRLDLYACVRPVRYFNGVPSPEHWMRQGLARIPHQAAEQTVEACSSLTSCSALLEGFSVPTVLGMPWLVLFPSAHPCSLDRSDRYALRSRARAEGEMPAPGSRPLVRNAS